MLHISLLPPPSSDKVAVVPKVKVEPLWEVLCGVQILQPYAYFPGVLATQAAKCTKCLLEACAPPLPHILSTPNNAFHKTFTFTKTATADTPALAVDGSAPYLAMPLPPS